MNYLKSAYTSFTFIHRHFHTKYVNISGCGPRNQWSQNVGAGGPHHRPHQLMASFSLDYHTLVEWGRHNELEASMVGAASSHVLGSLPEIHLEYFICTFRWLTNRIQQNGSINFCDLWMNLPTHSQGCEGKIPNVIYMVFYT